MLSLDDNSVISIMDVQKWKKKSSTAFENANKISHWSNYPRAPWVHSNYDFLQVGRVKKYKIPNNKNIFS